MADEREPRLVDAGAEAGGHGLGPHVVGLRVVVRRIVRGQTGPTGGPAFTDVLGTCLAWADGVCIVQTDAGEAVRIPWSLIVSGKPVPPRTPVRDRVSPREAQLRGLALFPDVATTPIGDTWLARRSATATARRANSVLAFGPSGLDADAELDAVLSSHPARPVLAVLEGSAEDTRYRGLGWVPESGDAPTVFQLAGTAQVLRALRSTPDTGVELEVDDAGLAVARVGGEGSPLATGIAACDGEWVGLRGVEVAPEARRRGLARAVVAELLDWGAAQGATTAYLQVLADNEPARFLYAGLGFRDHHTYGYLTPASPGPHT